ncbi:MAG: hypothetical protein ACR2JK_11330 [Geodermatophilaceae bacterium]
MSLFDIVRALRRHVVVVVFLLVASGFAAYGVYSQIPVYYQSDASMVVLLPSVAQGVDEQPVPVNPWSNLGALSSQVAASALATIASSEDFQRTLADLGVTSEVTVQVAPTYGGGVVLTLSAVSLDAPAARADLAVVSAQVSEALRLRQLAAAAPDGTLLTAADLSSATEPAPLATSGIKVAGVTVGIGLVIIAVVVLLLEGLRPASPRSKAPDKPAAPRRTPAVDTVPGQDEWLDADLWAESTPLVSQRS